jgi:hypothetical protein
MLGTRHGGRNSSVLGCEEGIDSTTGVCVDVLVLSDGIVIVIGIGTGLLGTLENCL